MKKVMCFGTFDILHKGHEFYLREAKKLGDFLVVVVALDKTVREVKGRPAKNDEHTRLANLQALGVADKVVLGHADDKFRVIEEELPHILCFGYDQQAFTEKAKERLAQRGLNVEIVRLPAYHPEQYKSSLLRKKGASVTGTFAGRHGLS